MKIRVEVDCTPDEARQFLGLPDVKPLQAVVMAKLESQVAEAMAPLSPEALVRSWLAFLPQTPEQMRDMLANLLRAPFAGFAPSAGRAGADPGATGETAEPGS